MGHCASSSQQRPPSHAYCIHMRCHALFRTRRKGQCLFLSAALSMRQVFARFVFSTDLHQLSSSVTRSSRRSGGTLGTLPRPRPEITTPTTTTLFVILDETNPGSTLPGLRMMFCGPAQWSNGFTGSRRYVIRLLMGVELVEWGL